MKKVLLIANDSINKKLYEKIYKWYDEAFKSINFETTWCSTTKVVPKYSNGLVFDENISDELCRLSFCSNEYEKYDLVFISLFSVDKYRDSYISKNFSLINNDMNRLAQCGDSYYLDKMKANASLLNIIQRCKELDVTCVPYTFDPMLDMRPHNSEMYSFLDIRNVSERLDILANVTIDFSAQKSKKLYDLLVAYNENLPFLVDVETYETRKGFERKSITESLLNNIDTSDNIKYNVTRFISDTNQNTTKIVSSDSTEKFTNDDKLSDQDYYESVKKSSKFTILLPNYNGLTWSYRRFFEDVSQGSIPLIIINSSVDKFDKADMLTQLPEELINFYNDNNLIVESFYDLSNTLKEKSVWYDENSERIFSFLNTFITNQQITFKEKIELLCETK